MSNLLHFPTDDPPLVRISTREQAAMIVADYRARKRDAAKHPSRRILTVDSSVTNAYNDSCYDQETREANPDMSGVRNRVRAIAPVAEVLLSKMPPRGMGTPQSANQTERAFKSDVIGNPREIRCSKSQLANILAVREERLAKEAAATVRPIREEAI